MLVGTSSVLLPGIVPVGTMLVGALVVVGCSVFVSVGAMIGVVTVGTESVAD